MMNNPFFSPAKINLFLRILAKRADGYHALATLMQAISLGDFIYIAPAQADRDRLTCSDSRIPLDRSNLALKAVELFRLKSGIPLYVTMHIDKRIPIEAGLGGGSSNAATALWAMNKLAGSPFSQETLQEWSATLGSDVPFFFAQGTAYCTGRGEHVQPIEPIDLPVMWIVKPPQGLSTRLVYEALEVNTLPARDPESSLMTFIDFKKMAREGVKFPLYNDLEGPALKLAPSLMGLYRALAQQYGDQLLLSGSGSSFFCLGEEAPRISEELVSEGCFVQRVLSIRRFSDGWYTQVDANPEKIQPPARAHLF